MLWLIIHDGYTNENIWIALFNDPVSKENAYTCYYLRIFFDLRVIKSTTNVSLGGV